MKKRQIFAVLGIVVLLCACALPMIFALRAGEDSGSSFKAAVAVAVFVPVFAYICMITYQRWAKKNPPPEGQIRNVIFDIGNVLMAFTWDDYLRGYGFPEEKYNRIADTVFRSPDWNERDRGDKTEEEYLDGFVSKAPEYEEEIREVMRRSPESIRLMDYTMSWVRYLKEEKGLRLFILSNYSEYMLEHTRQKMKFLKYMDGAVFSCEVKQIKPEKEIFITLLDRYHLRPEESVFIDDRADNCQTAGELGIRSIVFTSFKEAADKLENMFVFSGKK